MIERVESIQAKFQLLAFQPWQLDGFLDGHIYGREAGAANGVPGSGATPEGECEGADCRGLTGEVLQISGGVCVNVLLESGRIHQNGRRVEGESRWEGAGANRERIAGSPGNDAGRSPAAHNCVKPSRSITQEIPPLANG